MGNSCSSKNHHPLFLDRQSIQPIPKSLTQEIDDFIPQVFLQQENPKYPIQPEHNVFYEAKETFQNRNKFATQDIENEIVLLDSIIEVSDKLSLKSTQVIPAFILITNEEKGIINRNRFNLNAMLIPMNRLQAKKDLIELAKKSSICDGIQDFQESYSLTRNSVSNLRQYTKQSFFFKILNKGIRLLDSPSSSAYLRLIFSDIFFSIWEIYQNSSQNDEFTCWRGSKIEDQDLKRLQNNINNFIELQGFISTSKDLTVGQSYAENVLFQIKVPKKKFQKGKYDYGYANLALYSRYKNQKQVLFNAINIFKIVSVKQEEINYSQQQIALKKSIKVVRLQYCPVSEIRGKNDHDRTPTQQQLLINHQYIENRRKKLKNQGYSLFECQQYKKSLKWFQLNVESIEKQFEKKFFFKIQNLNKIEQSIKKNIQLKQICEDYWHSLYMISVNQNNLEKFQSASKTMLKCKVFEEKTFNQKVENLLIKKQIAKIELNLAKQKEGLKILQQILHEISSQNDFQCFEKLQLKEEILYLLLFWQQNYNKNVLLSLKGQLQRIKKTKGQKNIFYIVNLKNIVLYCFKHQSWSQIVSYADAILKFQEKTSKMEFQKLLYYVSMSYFQLSNIEQGKKWFLFLLKKIGFMINFQQTKMCLQILKLIFEKKRERQEQIKRYLQELIKRQPSPSLHNNNQMNQYERLIFHLYSRSDDSNFKRFQKFISGFIVDSQK